MKTILIFACTLCMSISYSQLIVNSKGEVDFGIKKVGGTALKKTLTYSSAYNDKVVSTIISELGVPSKPNVWVNTPPATVAPKTKKKGKKSVEKPIPPSQVTYSIEIVNNKAIFTIDDKTQDQQTKAKLLALFEKLKYVCTH